MLRPPLLRAPQLGLSVVRLPLVRESSCWGLHSSELRLAVIGECRLLWASLTAWGVECSQVSSQLESSYAETSTLEFPSTRVECCKASSHQRVILLKPPLYRAPLRQHYAQALSWASLTASGAEYGQVSSQLESRHAETSTLKSSPTWIECARCSLVWESFCLSLHSPELRLGSTTCMLRPEPH